MNSSAGSEGRAAYLLAQLNAGLVTQWSQIVEMDASLQHLLDDAHACPAAMLGNLSGT